MNMLPEYGGVLYGKKQKHKAPISLEAQKILMGPAKAATACSSCQNVRLCQILADNDRALLH